MTEVSADGTLLRVPAADPAAGHAGASQADGAAQPAPGALPPDSRWAGTALTADTAARGGHMQAMPQTLAAPAAVVSAASRPGIATIVRRLIVLALVIVQALLVLRIGLLAFAADAGNSLVGAVLQGSRALEAPFGGIFGANAIAVSGGAAIDVTAFVALLGWTLLQGALIALLSLASPSRRW